MNARDFKRFGLALFAVLALGALAGSSAQAATFQSSVAHTILSGTQSTTHVFSAGSGFPGITCKTVDFEGTTTEKISTGWEVEVNVSECEDSLGRAVHHSCAFGHIKYMTWTGAEHTLCVFGSKTEITNGSGKIVCTVTVPEQNNVGPLSFSNQGSAQVKVAWNANNVHSTTSGGLLNCGIGNGTHTAGTYTGSSIISGEDTEGNPATLRYE